MTHSHHFNFKRHGEVVFLIYLDNVQIFPKHFEDCKINVKIKSVGYVNICFALYIILMLVK